MFFAVLFPLGIIIICMALVSYLVSPPTSQITAPNPIKRDLLIMFCLTLTLILSIFLCSLLSATFAVDDSYFPFCNESPAEEAMARCREHLSIESNITVEVAVRLAVPPVISLACYSTDERVCALADSVLGEYTDRKRDILYKLVLQCCTPPFILLSLLIAWLLRQKSVR